jgi:hypothetical protein
LRHLAPGYAFACVSLLASACRPAAVSSPQTVENFGSGAFHRNVCSASPSPAAFDAALPQPFAIQVNVPDVAERAALFREVVTALTAIPTEIQQAFSTLHGEILLTASPTKFCHPRRGSVLPETQVATGCVLMTFYRDATGTAAGAATDSFEDLAQLPAAQPTGPRKLRSFMLVLGANVDIVRHDLVRQFGYAYAQIYSHLFLDAAGHMVFDEARRPDPFLASRAALVRAFLRDALGSSFVPRAALDDELGAGGAATVEANLAAGRAWSQGLFAKDGETTRLARLDAFMDAVIADAFDSTHCNDWAPYERGAAEADLRARRNTPALRNTARVFDDFFHDTATAFAAFEADYAAVTRRLAARAGTGAKASDTLRVGGGATGASLALLEDEAPSQSWGQWAGGYVGWAANAVNPIGYVGSALEWTGDRMAANGIAPSVAPYVAGTGGALSGLNSSLNGVPAGLTEVALDPVGVYQRNIWDPTTARTQAIADNLSTNAGVDLDSTSGLVQVAAAGGLPGRRTAEMLGGASFQQPEWQAPMTWDQQVAAVNGDLQEITAGPALVEGGIGLVRAGGRVATGLRARMGGAAPVVEGAPAALPVPEPGVPPLPEVGAPVVEPAAPFVEPVAPALPEAQLPLPGTEAPVGRTPTGQPIVETVPPEGAPFTPLAPETPPSIYPRSGAQGLIGPEFEDFLVRSVDGAEGSFKMGGREFDGRVGSRWWEAKSGEYWDMVMSDPKNLTKFKSDIGARGSIARGNGATYEVVSNTPIPPEVKAWLDAKGYGFHEVLE